MGWFPDLKSRHREPEIMDQPGLDGAAHVQALAALRRINFWSGTAGTLWRALAPLARQHDGPLRVLDVATGGGDTPICLWQKARRAGIGLVIEGCDKSATAIEHARRQAERAGADVRFFTLDVLAERVPAEYDVATCALFLHHLDEEPAVELLRRLAGAARRLVLVSDLARCRSGYLAAYLGTRLLTTSPVARVDGPLSVQGAYTPAEALALAERAGLVGATVRRSWPFRFLLSWEPRRASAKPG
jgi:2-polyprenyl-3-methyl-5-hydroxy-6-metoxy-1,4-benzoquinol methylase